MHTYTTFPILKFLLGTFSNLVVSITGQPAHFSNFVFHFLKISYSIVLYSMHYI